jgi:hypothetical protein
MLMKLLNFFNDLVFNNTFRSLVTLLFFSDCYLHILLVSEGYILLMEHLKLQILKLLLWVEFST